jgi:hypothetical protein
MEIILGTITFTEDGAEVQSVIKKLKYHDIRDISKYAEYLIGCLKCDYIIPMLYNKPIKFNS